MKYDNSPEDQVQILDNEMSDNKLYTFDGRMSKPVTFVDASTNTESKICSKTKMLK